MEEWKVIEGYDGIYYVSNKGNVKSIEHIVQRSDGTTQRVQERIIKHHIGRRGYHQVELRDNKKSRYPLVHRIVAETFIENPYNKPQVNHIDGDKSNNNVENLEWVTCSENIKHSYDKKIRKPNPPRKLTVEDVQYIKSHYRFRSKTCDTLRLSERFGVSKETIRRVVVGNTYKEL